MQNPFRYFNSSPEVDPPRGDDVRPFSAFAATGRGSLVRAGHRHPPRDGSVLVEPVRSDVRGRDQETTRSSTVVFAMAFELVPLCWTGLQPG